MTGVPPAAGAVRTRLALALLIAVPAAIVAGALLGGEAARLGAAGAPAAPLLLLALLASLAVERPAFRLAARLCLGLVLAGIVGVASLAGTAALLGERDLLGASDGLPARALEDPVLRQVVLLNLALLLGLAASVLPLVPRARQPLAALLPVDPGTFRHAAAVAVLSALALAPLVALAVVGRPPLLALAGAAGDPGGGGGQLAGLFYGLAWLVPTAFVAAGVPLLRSPRAAAARLGLARPDARRAAVGVALGVALLIVSAAAQAAVTALWAAAGWPRTDLAAFSRLIGAVVSPVGALAVGVTAGLGEELAVRGLLQPRVGWLLSNLAFTSVHAFQYGPDGLVPVFVLGTALAAVRHRTDTTVSAIAHGAYNTLAVLAAVAAQSGPA